MRQMLPAPYESMDKRAAAHDRVSVGATGALVLSSLGRVCRPADSLMSLSQGRIRSPLTSFFLHKLEHGCVAPNHPGGCC
jgi:hypothetical protein